MTAATTSLQTLQPQLAALNERLALWQRRVHEELAKIIDPKKSTEDHDATHAQQHDALRTAMMRAGDGPRNELNIVIDELCHLYLEATDEERTNIRATMASVPMVLRDLWGYVHRAAEQVRAGGGEPWLRFGLAVVSIEDLRVDYHDTYSGLEDLYNAALEMKLDPVPAFAEVSAISNHHRVQNATISTRDLLLNFKTLVSHQKPQH